MKRWHLFNAVSTTPSFGFDTIEQARHHLARLDARRAINPYTLTTLEENEQPPDGALVVDLDSGETLPDRYARK